jgi:hypothetical protein
MGLKGPGQKEGSGRGEGEGRRKGMGEERQALLNSASWSNTVNAWLVLAMEPDMLEPWDQIYIKFTFLL